MERNELGHFAKGNRIGTPGLTPKEKRASQRLRQRLSALVDDAALVLEQVVAGEEIDKARVDAAKYIVDRCLGKPGQTRTIEGHIDHQHQHLITMQDGYLAAMKSLAAVKRAELAGTRQANGQALAELKVIDVAAAEDAEHAAANADKVRYSERARAKDVADG
jgi:hypothetical protein